MEGVKVCDKQPYSNNQDAHESENCLGVSEHTRRLRRHCGPPLVDCTSARAQDIQGQPRSAVRDAIVPTYGSTLGQDREGRRTMVFEVSHGHLLRGATAGLSWGSALCLLACERVM